MSGRRPWFKFYPADWQADQALRLVGLEARGLWLECMCIMHRADPYGHLVVNGRPVTDVQLAVLAGTPPDRVPALVAELETAGVFSRNRAGTIYSRRMTRDEKQRKDGETAKITGSTVPGSRRHQTIEKTGGKLPTTKVETKVEKQPPPHPEARSQIPKEKKRGSNDPPKEKLSERELAREFAEIWLLFPKRVARGEAWKEYPKARQIGSFEEIKAGVVRYAEMRRGEDDHYTKHPSRWLKYQCWADETPGPANGAVPDRPDGPPPPLTERELEYLKTGVLQ